MKSLGFETAQWKWLWHGHRPWISSWSNKEKRWSRMPHHGRWKGCSYRNVLNCNSINNSNNVTDKCRYPWSKWGLVQEPRRCSLTRVAKTSQGVQLGLVPTTKPPLGKANSHKHTCTGCRDQEQPMGHFVLQQVAACRDDASDLGTVYLSLNQEPPLTPLI